ncbi:hypothetical protein [Paraliomyxa miuraensis]|uniref:hypothetical protein n=1 Tax=Paraliomyxa miuraensis TaxID=376150 RepID=UPI00225067D2|nr:hypothetical protein [Paraliomyxa miuraensis]MCX4247549.1 hypothetical protein [Paraliomyxa miuraensis]
MRWSIAAGMLSFAALMAVAGYEVRSMPAPTVALEREADASGVCEGSLCWHGRFTPAEDRSRIQARIDRGPPQAVTLEGDDLRVGGVGLPAQPLAPGVHFVELTIERRGGRVTTITDEVRAGPWQSDHERGCDLSLTVTPQGLFDLLVPVLEAKLLAGARTNEYFGPTSFLARKELVVVDGGLRFDVLLDTTEEGKGDLAVAGIVDVHGDGEAGIVASLRKLEHAAPGPKLEALARAEGSRRLRGVGAAVGGGLVAAAGGGVLLGLAAAAGGDYLGSRVGEGLGERTARREVRREAQEQIERALAVATDALRLPDDVVVLPTEPALRADLRWCGPPVFEEEAGLRASLRVGLRADEASDAAARAAVWLGTELGEPRAPSRPNATVHADVSGDFVNRLLAEWVVRGGLQTSLDASGLRQQVQELLGERTRWRVEALRVELPPMVRLHDGDRIDAVVGGVALELLDPERDVARTVMMGGTGALRLLPEPEPGRLRLGGMLDAVYFGCRERDEAIVRRLPCFSSAVDPHVLRERLDEQLRTRSDALPVLDLGGALRLEALGDGEIRALQLRQTWVSAEDGRLAIDARVE